MTGNTSERTPLTSREYYAIREMFGIVSTYEKAMGHLEKRAKKLPGAWRDMHMISAKAQRLIAALLSTVPADKLKLVEKELDNTVVNVDVVRRGLPQPKTDAFTYVPQEALETLIGGIVQEQCLLCEKDKRQSKKCPWRIAIEATYPWELPELHKEHCRFSGWTIENEGSDGE